MGQTKKKRDRDIPCTSRMKHHLTGTNKNVIPCTSVPDEVKRCLRMFNPYLLILLGLQQFNLIFSRSFAVLG
jgi:hypothetical protein